MVTDTLETLIGRRPIFDRDLSVTGYDLVFQAVDGAPGAPATPDALLGDPGADIVALVGAKEAVCPAGPGVLSGEVAVAVPPERVVVAVRPPVGQDAAALEACRRLRAQGYRLSLAGFPWEGVGDEPLSLAWRVTVDAAALGDDRLAATLDRCRHAGVEVVATGVDSPEHLAACAPYDVALFGGYLLARPHGEPGRQLAPGRLAGLRMSARLLDAECPVSEIEEIVRGDPAMTHQLLQLAGIGAAGGMKRSVASVRQALVFVGWRRLQSWVALLLLSDDGEASEEEIATVLMRARMSELLAPAAGCEADAGYTGGMLSSLDVVLGLPLEQILDTLPLDPALRAAVLEGDGPLGRLIADVIDVQLGRPGAAVRCGIGAAALRWAAIEALTWTVGMTSVLETARAA